MAIDQQAQTIAKQYGLDPNIFASLIQTESSLNPNVGANSLGYSGLGQLSPALVHQYGINPANANENLTVSAKTLSSFLSQYHGNYLNALSNYKGAENNPLARSQAQHVLDVAASNAMISGSGNVVANSGSANNSSAPAPDSGMYNSIVSPSLYNSISNAASNATSAVTNALPSIPSASSIGSAIMSPVTNAWNSFIAWLQASLANVALVIVGGVVLIGVLFYAIKDPVTDFATKVAAVGA